MSDKNVRKRCKKASKMPGKFSAKNAIKVSLKSSKISSKNMRNLAQISGKMKKPFWPFFSVYLETRLHQAPSLHVPKEYLASTYLSLRCPNGAGSRFQRQLSSG
jgi:hypothetical protein